ncbi:hypothetical protein RRG08_043932 [Elysia crispata]|uniref:Uncharacterized protein n=1 Tax=Elysia crispata TaxID=231223 RepID=A0AAE0Y0B2_9GAST|nr:hypothetical protein RRG08_043932 [Elysia crispata]
MNEKGSNSSVIGEPNRSEQPHLLLKLAAVKGKKQMLDLTSVVLPGGEERQLIRRLSRAAQTCLPWVYKLMLVTFVAGERKGTELGELCPWFDCVFQLVYNASAGFVVGLTGAETRV